MNEYIGLSTRAFKEEADEENHLAITMDNSVINSLGTCGITTNQLSAGRLVTNEASLSG